MRITWNTEIDAPCCPGEIIADDGRTLLIQTDWDYPGVALSFGWSLRDVQRCGECGHVQTEGLDGEKHPLCADCMQPFVPCDHDGTDGTVDCPECGLTAGEFISAAGDWLHDNDGATVTNPGYFE
jgi:hypothetical protein